MSQSLTRGFNRFSANDSRMILSIKFFFFNFSFIAQWDGCPGPGLPHGLYRSLNIWFPHFSAGYSRRLLSIQNFNICYNFLLTSFFIIQFILCLFFLPLIFLLFLLFPNVIYLLWMDLNGFTPPFFSVPVNFNRVQGSWFYNLNTCVILPLMSLHKDIF